MTTSRLKQVRAQVRAWAENRSLYPGWIVAPHARRETLWQFTQFWIDPILACLPEMGVEEERPGTPPRPERAISERLGALDELNWRLETALVPLFPPIVDALVRCLEEINPFPKSLQLPHPTVALTAENLGEFKWAEIRQTWLRLAFAVVRFYREERSHAEFDKWIGRIRAAVRDYPEHQPRLCYERCLTALSKMDDEAVNAALDDWPPTSQDPIWRVRRAAVLAEVGRLQDAKALAESALQELRLQLGRRPEEIHTLSREGWTMRLLPNIHNALATVVNLYPDYLGRWEYLTRYHCNPEPELEILRSKLDQPAPQQAPHTTHRPGFQPGTYSVSYSGGGNLLAKLLPAYQFMRLTEEAPYPPRCGNWILSEKVLEHVARWFSRHDVVRTLTLTCRLASEGVIKTFLTRHRVAALPIDSVEELHTVSMHAIREGIHRIPVPGNPREPEVERALRRVEAGITILARVVVRLPQSRLGELLTLATELYNSMAVRQHMTLPRELSELFQSLMLAMPREDLEARALELVSLPVPGSRTFPVRLPQHWPEPALDLPQRLQGLKRAPRNALWARAVAMLLEAAAEEAWEVRSNALGRLLVLHHFGVLTNSELGHWSRLIWRKVSQATGLPEMPGVQNSACLSLPGPPGRSVVDLFRRYLAQGNLLRFTQPVAGADGVVRRQFTAYLNPDAYILDWLGATEVPGGPTKPGREFVNWKRTEAVSLLRKFRDWWEEEGRDLLITTANSPYFGSMQEEPIRRRLEWILEALRRIIIPRARPGTTLAREVMEFVDDMDSRNVAVEPVLPALLHLDPGRVRATASRLRRALAAHDEKKQRAALNGLASWLRNQTGSPLAVRGYQLPRMPENLLQELGSIIANRRQPGLLVALEAAITVLERFPHRANRGFIDSLRVGLDSLLAETEYRANDEPGGQVPYEAVPTYRMLAARLANLLAGVRGGRSEVVDRWIEAARTDPLPEVRQAVGAPAEPRTVEV
jgi:hypothetical protein